MSSSKTASDSMKVFLRQGHKLLLEEKCRLINSAQKEENQLVIDN